MTLTRRGSIANALPQAIAAQASQPVRSARQELALPTQADLWPGQALHPVRDRMTLSGGGDELVVLAKTNMHKLAAE